MAARYGVHKWSLGELQLVFSTDNKEEAVEMYQELEKTGEILTLTETVVLKTSTTAQLVSKAFEEILDANPD